MFSNIGLVHHIKAHSVEGVVNTEASSDFMCSVFFFGFECITYVVELDFLFGIFASISYYRNVLLACFSTMIHCSGD